MPLPQITKTTDIAGTTVDDAANLPSSSVYQCQEFIVDVRGPGFTAGDVTWSVLDSANAAVSGAIVAGNNTIQATIMVPATEDPGEYTIKAALTSNMTDFSTFTFNLLALPAITVGTPNQAYVGGQTQFETSYPFAVDWLPAEVNASSGLATWASAGLKTVSYTPAGESCPVTRDYIVYPAVAVAEYNGTDPLYINSGDSLALTVSGGSGVYSYSINGQNSINNSGVIQAGLYAGEYTLTVVDNNAGVIQQIPVFIGSQSQFCVQVEPTVCDVVGANPCCEISLDCGESVTLKVPTFKMRVNGAEQEIRYVSAGGGTTGDAAYLKSAGSGITNAKANNINCVDNESLFEIVTSLDMADVANDPFGIGFSQFDSGSGVNSIDTGVVWFTDTSTRYVEVRREGVAEADSKFAILQGDAVSAGYRDGKFVLYINNLLKYENLEISCCGNQFLDIAIEEPNKSIGGNLSGLTWTIITPGLPNEVGTINGSGVYVSPSETSYGLVEAEATVGNATFRINIRNVKPTPRITRPDFFLAGRPAEIWVGKYKPGFNEPIRLAKDGSPDALQNPGMINLGVLEGSATFSEAFEFQDFDNDNGTYWTTTSKESASLTARFLEVRDLYKLSNLMPHATLHAKNNGVTEISVGGRTCGVGEMRVIMVVGKAGVGCEGEAEFDVLYIPRVQNKGNLGLEVGKRAAGGYELTLTALPDYTRPAGKQLYSIYQIDGCSSTNCAV